jgi:quercetin dioxygenase-like cupin family protein
MKTGPDPALAADVLAAMLPDVAAEQLPTGVAARMRQRIRQRTAAAAGIARGDSWHPFVDKAEIKILHDDGIRMSWMVRMQPGGELPPHVHEHGDEECVVLEGEVWVDDRRFGPGDYTVALQGSAHRRVYTPTGALFYLRSASAQVPRAVRLAAA